MSPQLPEGTVSFLFTDVEDSTGLARRLGEGYVELIGEHFRLIEDVLHRCGGVQVKTTGDGVFAVFVDASDAVRSAGEIQRAIAGHEWPLGGEVRVRVGVHTGEATITEDGDYIGLEVHRASRTMAAGHGGQVLASETTHALAGAGFEFHDLGRHLLKGLEDEELLYQLIIPGLPSEFPPLATAVAIPNNLPTRASSVVGRGDDLAALAELIEQERLVTLLGPGGVGKTSLAVTAAASSIQRFPGGVTFVDLSSVNDPTFVVPSIAVELSAEPRTVDGVAEKLAGEPSLLVLDNFEQVIESAPDLGRLMAMTASPHFLVTSQVPLRLSGERRLVLGPLVSADGEASPGVELFLDRARAVAPEFDVAPEVVEEIVRHVDGLPLAIELVAARANLLGADQMLERLQTGRMSYARAADSPARHRSLEDAIAWSCDLLDDPTREVFETLGLFAGGFTLEAAEEVAGGADGVDVLGAMGELVDRSLLIRSLESSGRFRMLDSIRRFARTRLEGSNRADQVVTRFVSFYERLAAQAYHGLQSDRGEWWLAQLEDEVDNLREVMATMRADRHSEEGLVLLGNVWRFYQSRGHLLELQTWLDRFFDLQGTRSDTVGVVKGLMAQAAVHYWQGRLPEAVDEYVEAVDRARRLDDDALLGEALFGLATSLIIGDRTTEAIGPLEECKKIYAHLDDKSGLADVLAAEAFAIVRERGLPGLGETFHETRELYESVGRRVQAAQSRFAEAAVALAEGRLADARYHSSDGLRRGIAMADVFLQAWGVGYSARVEIDAGNTEKAAILAGALETAREHIGGGWGPETVGLEDARTALIRSLGEEEAARLMAPGRELSLDEAVALALDG